jgi:two-component system chemotaxis sensor kinase CheA
MRKRDQKAIESFLEIAKEAHNLAPDDGDAIIRVGAGLEQLLQLPNTPPQLTQFAELSIEALKALHLRTAVKPEDLVNALKEAFATAEKELSCIKSGTPLDISSKPIDILQAALEEKPAMDESEEDTEQSLDDIAAALVQIEPTDIKALRDLRKALGKLCTSSACEEISKACELVDQLISGNSEDPNDTLAEVSRLIEAVMNASLSEEYAPSTEDTSDSPNEPLESSPDSSDAEVHSTESAVWMLPPDADPSLLSEFITECGDYIEKAEAALLTLESNPTNAEAVNTVFRAFHTIKGTSAFLELNHISELAHLAESLLARVRDGEIHYTGIYADLALQSVDMLKELIQGVQDAIGGLPMKRPQNYDNLISKLANPDSLGAEETISPQPLRPEDVTILEGAESPASESSESEDTLEAAKKEIAVQVNQATQAQKTLMQEVKPESFVRVRTDRLDRLIDMVGELVIAQSMVSQDETVVLGGHHELSKKVVHLGKIVRELQYLSMSMRMVPLKPTFQKAARMVRDLAQKFGKQINFVAEGEDTEIDRNMVDLINDPLVHMIRNAVDHGIEPPDEREKAGKPREGLIRLSAYHASGNVVVELSDDGRGLDKEKIVRKAIEKGLITSDKGMSDSDIYNLIFAPGFSTADTVTEVSGRGVGMDVVKKNIEALRGRIDISSELGKGSTFIIRLPLTMAVTDGMLVQVGSERFIIPTVNIRLSFRPEPEWLSTVVGQGEMVMLRGELMPIFRLHKLFNIEGAQEDPTKALLVVVDDGEKHCALLVDEIIGQQHVVAKSLGESLGKIQGLSGGAILGDGCVGLILDTAEIVALARHQTSRTTDEKHQTLVA